MEKPKYLDQLLIAAMSEFQSLIEQEDTFKCLLSHENYFITINFLVSCQLGAIMPQVSRRSETEVGSLTEPI